jgi:predicted small lipoprotein YifL
MYAAVAFATVALAALTGCGVDGPADVPSVSRQTLQSDISDDLAKLGDPPLSVTCHEDLIGQVGRTVRCDVVMTDANRFQPIVTVSRVDGSTVDYEMTPAISQEQLEKDVSRLIAQNSGDRVDSVACESGLEGRVDAIAHCDVDAGGTKARRTVRVTEVSGLTMDFNLVAE